MERILDMKGGNLCSTAQPSYLISPELRSYFSDFLNIVTKLGVFQGPFQLHSLLCLVIYLS